MSKKTTTIIGVLFMAFLLFGGILFLSRATRTKNDLKIIDGKVIYKNKTYSTSIKSGRFYYLEFTLENKSENLAIGYSSEKQSINDSTYYKIEIGKNYRFFVDKSFPNSDGTNYGIDYIENSNKIIFSKDPTMELYFSISLILISIIFIILGIRKLKKNEC